MGLETGNTINDLNESWPLGTDPKSQGDDHIRLCKRVFKNDVLSTTNGGTISGDVDFAGDVNFAGNVTGLAQTANPSLIINGGFDIWQRGTSFSTVNIYTADRWYVSGGTKTVSRSNVIPTDSTRLYSAKITASAGAACLLNPIELPATGTRRPFAQDTVWTLSFYILDNNGTGGSPIRAQGYFSDGVNGNNVFLLNDNTQTTSAGSVWKKVSYTFTANQPANPTNTSFIVCVGLDGVGDCNIIEVKLEQGSVATPWFYEDYGTTLAKCQRYYEKSYGDSILPGGSDSEGLRVALSNDAGLFNSHVDFKVNKRTIPTVTLWNPTGGAESLSPVDIGRTAFTANQEGGTPNSSSRYHFVADAEL